MCAASHANLGFCTSETELYLKEHSGWLNRKCESSSKIKNYDTIILNNNRVLQFHISFNFIDNLSLYPVNLLNFPNYIFSDYLYTLAYQKVFFII